MKWVCVVKLNDSNGFCPSTSQHPQSNIRLTVNLSNVTESCCCSVVSAAVVYDACYKCIVSGLSMPCDFHTRFKMASDVCARAVSFNLIALRPQAMFMLQGKSYMLKCSAVEHLKMALIQHMEMSL